MAELHAPSSPVKEAMGIHWYSYYSPYSYTVQTALAVLHFMQKT